MMKKSLVLLAALLVAAPSFTANSSTSPLFPLKDSGVFPIPYEKYGTFTGLGANDYKYKITDRAGLAKIIGQGLYPNLSGFPSDPVYLKWRAKHPGPLSPWDSVRSGDPQSDFYTWATGREVAPGVKLLYSGLALAQAGHIKEALKAFHAVLIHFPREICWSADRTFFWYVGNEALNQIVMTTEAYPELGWQLKGAQFKVQNGTDTNIENDIFTINPGTWEPYKPPAPVAVDKLKIIKQRGYGKVQLVQFENKHWQMRVDGNPFMVHGITYGPTPVGQHVSSYADKWMFDDANENGRPDSAYDTFVDKNGNGKQDADEPAVGDFKLMQDMGVNAIRIYRKNEGTQYDPRPFNKDLLRDLYKTYGIRAIMGEFLGAYTLGSGASWEEGTDYTDPVQLENMRLMVKNYVLDHRKEPYVLMWLLGNENLMPSDYSGVNATRTKASTQVAAYLKFVNEMADLIHKLDPDHPVGVANLDLLFIDEYAKYAPSIDIFGANMYKGPMGFGRTWKVVAETYDRPVLVTEYGCDAWDSRANKENEKAQADYHRGNWKNIKLHAAGSSYEGNAIGGVVFEFTDEWWKSVIGSWDSHDTDKDSAMPFPDGWSGEEWYGMTSLADGSNNPFLRVLRKVYSVYRDELWKN